MLFEGGTERQIVANLIIESCMVSDYHIYIMYYILELQDECILY